METNKTNTRKDPFWGMAMITPVLLIPGLILGGYCGVMIAKTRERQQEEIIQAAIIDEDHRIISDLECAVSNGYSESLDKANKLEVRSLLIQGKEEYSEREHFSAWEIKRIIEGYSSLVKLCDDGTFHFPKP